MALPAPSSDETTMALVAHVLQISTWWIEALAIYLATRGSKFASFHAMPSLLWQCTMTVVGMIGFAVWMIFSSLTAFPHMARPSADNSGPPFFFAFFSFFSLGFMGWGSGTSYSAIIICGEGSRFSIPRGTDSVCRRLFAGHAPAAHSRMVWLR
jgi:hypothetical protein